MEGELDRVAIRATVNAMGQLLRWCCVVALVSGCSKKEDKGGPAPGPGSAVAATGPGAAAATAQPKPDDKPPPPDDVRKGDARVVNLLHDEAGKPVTIDIWGKRSFEHGPVQFAKNIAYGQASPHFGIPKGTSTIAVIAGGHVDDAKVEVGSVAAAKDGEEITTLMYRNYGKPSSIVRGAKPAGVYNAPEPPAAGKGLVYFYAGPLIDHEDKLRDKYGGRTFYVGDGSTTCRPQRIEAAGKQPAMLGGTNPTEYELAPGKAKFTFHKWQPGKDCTTPAVLETEVDVVEGKGTFVILHSPDAGGSIEALQLPLWK